MGRGGGGVPLPFRSEQSWMSGLRVFRAWKFSLCLFSCFCCLFDGDALVMPVAEGHKIGEGWGLIL